MRAATSIEAFHSISVPVLQRKEQEVMDWFRSHPRMAVTREQLAGYLGWKEAAVCGRVNSLVAKKVLEEVAGGMSASGRSAKLVRLPVPKDAQGDLFR